MGSEKRSHIMKGSFIVVLHQKRNKPRKRPFTVVSAGKRSKLMKGKFIFLIN